MGTQYDRPELEVDIWPELSCLLSLLSALSAVCSVCAAVCSATKSVLFPLSVCVLVYSARVHDIDRVKSHSSNRYKLYQQQKA